MIAYESDVEYTEKGKDASYQCLLEGLGIAKERGLNRFGEHRPPTTIHCHKGGGYRAEDAF